MLHEFVDSVHYYLFSLSSATNTTIDNNDNDDNDNNGRLSVRESWLCHPPTQKDVISMSMLGLFASKKIKSNDVICQYNGVCLNTKDALQLNDKSYLMRIGEQCYIDARLSAHCLARYINDCRNNHGYNARFIKSMIERCAWVVAMRDIEPGEEIFADYGKWYWAGAAMVVNPIRLSITDLAKLKNIV